MLKGSKEAIEQSSIHWYFLHFLSKPMNVEKSETLRNVNYGAKEQLSLYLEPATVSPNSIIKVMTGQTRLPLVDPFK